jgi:leader peptidase (prepilin peptidase) / N-methyltransferase
MSAATTALAVSTGIGCCLLASPYLARLTLSAPDRADLTWWRGQTASMNRVLAVAGGGVVAGLLAGLSAGFGALLPAFVVLAAIAVPLAVIDIEHHRLPDRLVAAAAIAAAVLLTVAAAIRHDWVNLRGAALGAVAVFAVLYLIAFVSPRAFGFGDVKVGAVLGAYLGWFGWLDVYYGVFAGFLLAGAVALAALGTRRATMKTAIAFGPALLAGPLVVLGFHLVSGLGLSS